MQEARSREVEHQSSSLQKWQACFRFFFEALSRPLKTALGHVEFVLMHQLAKTPFYSPHFNFLVIVDVLFLFLV